MILYFKIGFVKKHMKLYPKFMEEKPQKDIKETKVSEEIMN